MPRTIRHSFVSAVIDDAEPGLLSPDDWNADHVLVDTPRTVTAAGSVTVAVDDSDILIAKTIADTTTINLPASATYTGGDLFIKDLNGVCETFNFAVVPFAGENIDGLSSYPMTMNYAHLHLKPKSGGWYVKGAM